MVWKRSKKNDFFICPAAKKIDKLVRRVTFFLAGIGLLSLTCVAILAGYTFYRINRAVDVVLNPDLSAFEYFVSQKIVTLTKEQKEKLTPLVRGLTDPLPGLKKFREHEDIQWDVKKPKPEKAVKEWQEKTYRELGMLVKKSSVDVSEKIDQYSSQPKKKLKSNFKKLSDWWYHRWSRRESSQNGLGIVESLEPN